MTHTELADKIEHATNPPGGTWGDYVRLDYDCWRMVVAALRSSEADQRDTARYRWLRNSHNQGANSPTAEGIIVCTDRPAKEPRYIGPLAWQLLDAAIDAAMRSGVSDGIPYKATVQFDHETRVVKGILPSSTDTEERK